MDALKSKSGAEWRALFDARSRGPLDASGVWNKREWVNPELAPGDVVTLGEGATPLTHATRLARELDLAGLGLKQCGTSHTGSFKDLGMTGLVSTVRYRVRTVALARPVLACPSTGHTPPPLAIAPNARAMARVSSW